MTVSISHNRDVQFEFTTQFQGQQRTGNVAVSTFRGWEDEGKDGAEDDKDRGDKLPEVNQPIRGARP